MPDMIVRLYDLPSLLAALHAQRSQGYAYSIIGGVGPAEYYTKVVAAQLIDGSTPGIFGQALPFKPPAA